MFTSPPPVETCLAVIWACLDESAECCSCLTVPVVVLYFCTYSVRVTQCVLSVKTGNEEGRV